MSRPTMTFSLRPRRLSTAPLIDASVSTRVVSWKRRRGDEAFGGERGLGDAEQQRASDCRTATVGDHAVVSLRGSGTCPPAVRAGSWSRRLPRSSPSGASAGRWSRCACRRWPRPGAGRLPGFRSPGKPCSSFSPSTARMSCGLSGPSISGSPARTRSPSWTLMWMPRGTEYSFSSPLSAVT